MNWDCGEPPLHRLSNLIIMVIDSHPPSLAVAKWTLYPVPGYCLHTFCPCVTVCFLLPCLLPYLTVLAPSLVLNFTWFLPRTTASPFPCPRTYLISSNSSILSSGFLFCSLEHGRFLSELLLGLSYCACQFLSKRLPPFKSSCEE